MPATSRWVYFDPNSSTGMTAQTYETISGAGNYGYVESANATSGTVTIVAGVSDQMKVSINGNAYQQITLTSGSNLDSRMVAREIEFKLKQLIATEMAYATVDFVNNKFRIRSSKLGASSSVAVNNGTNDCLQSLGMAASQGGPLTVTTVAGAATLNNAAYTGQLTASGVFKGQFSDIYSIMIGTIHPVGNVVASGANLYAGTPVSAGDWDEASNETYTVTISTANGAVQNAGTGSVPTFTVTSTLGDNVVTPIELLHSDFYYNIGSKGLRLKFSDAPFGNGDTFTIACTAIQYATAASGTSGAVGTAQYVWSSHSEGKSSSPTTTQVTGTAVGTKGVTVSFSNSGVLTRRDKFKIICSGPQPTTLGITVLNFGAVVVSAYSPTKVVWFELLSGANVLSTTRFGLNSHGSATQHFAGNNDTKFAFGNSGNGTPASDGTEWKQGIVGNTDLASNTPPSYLAATQANLAVVSTATDSQPLGVAYGQMVSDFIYLAIKLGSLESGPNSTIVYRMYYDFS
jgi:hypothetical protein